MKCFCGCTRRAGQRHHVVYQQHIREWAPRGLVRRLTGWEPDLDGFPTPAERRPLRALLRDERNLVDVAMICHGEHHSRATPFRLHMLPDSAFEFAAELFGPDAAYEYLARRYHGGDDRHDALIREALRAA